jgi:ABC-type dipeptide/oligopeptide/nickel transport system permease component
MLVYTIRRFLQLTPLVLGMILIVMLLPRFIPGDAVTIMLGTDAVISQARADEIRKLLGLDRSIPQQYWDYLVALSRGDMGNSLRSGRPLGPIIAERFGLTANIALLSLAMAVVFGVPLGVIGARYRHARWSVLLQTFNLIGLSFPTFWIGTILLIAATHVFPGWFPTLGSAGPDAPWLEQLRFAFLPSLTLAIPVTAVLARITQSSMIEVLAQDYVTVARAKGLAERTVFYKHALRNSLIPVVTELGLQAGLILGGVVTIELVFSYPGIGLLVLNAINQRDYPILQSVLLIVSGLFFVVNYLVDLSYAFLNPLIVYE